jgi:hypothetical protein
MCISHLLHHYHYHYHYFLFAIAFRIPPGHTPPSIQCIQRPLSLGGETGSEDTAPYILSWWWVVSATPWSLYHRGKNSSYLLDRRLGGPHSRSGCGVLPVTKSRSPIP